MTTPAIANLVLETSSSDGTGNLTLAALNGKRTFASAFSTGSTPDVFWYFISNSNALEWEWGTGHMSDATTLVRDTVIGSSNANAAVNFSDGVKYIGNDLPAANTLIDDIGSLLPGHIYNSAGTNTGEAFGYSVRNSTTTGQSLYAVLNNGVVSNILDGFQSVLNIPSTATVGGASGLSSYFSNNATATVNAVGLFTAGLGTTTGAPIWGLNTLLMDNATRVTHSRTGQYLIGAELDFNVMGANTVVIGISVGGNSLAQPAAANAFSINALGASSKWTGGFISYSGAVGGPGVQLGSTAATGTSVASQTIQLLYWNAGSLSKNITISALNAVLTVASNESTSQLTLGIAGSSQGSLTLQGATSGGIILTTQAAAGTPTITWGTSSGTPAISVPSPLSLSTTTGAVTWSGLTSGGVLYASGTTSVGSSALLTQYGILYGGGAGNPPVSVAAMTDGQLLVGQTGAAPLPKTLSSDATLSAAGALTLASTIAAGGPTGSATVAPIITYDAKGRLTTVSSATITPAVGSVTGLGTGVATALGVNVGSAGAFITFGGALGSPSSAGTIPAHTLGGTISGGGNQINNVIIGTSTPLAGAFTTLSATGQITSTLATGTAPFAVTSTTQVANLYVARAALADAAAVGTITGLGTGVATALAVNIGTAGSFVVNGGALGSPSSAGTLPAHTLGGSISGGGQTITNLASVALRDTTAAFDVTFSATSTSATLTAGRILTLDMGNVAHTIQLGTTANTITFPSVVSDTVVMLAATQTLTGKTLDTSVGKGTWTASGTWTLPAHTLGGTVSGGGNQLNNVVIGTSTPLAGSFTGINGTSLVINGSSTVSGASASLIPIVPTITNNGSNFLLVNANPIFNGSGDSPIAYSSGPQYSPSASINTIISGIFGGYISPPIGVTIANAYAGEFQWQFLNTTGAVTAAHAIYVSAPVIYGVLKPATMFGVHVANQGASGITTSYGLYIDAQSGSSTNTSFYDADTLDATSTTVASVVLAGGLAAAKALITGTNLWHPTIANALIATVLGSLGPTGSHTTVQEWFPIKNAAGTIRYVPGF